MSYGTGQRIAFAGLVIGFLMCTSGAIAPFWQQGSLSMNSVAEIFKETIPFIGDIKVANFYGGLWWYCLEVIGHTECETYNFTEDRAKSDWAIRIACVVNVLLTLLCALVALCRSCCCAGGRTVCHGVIAFVAGATGIITVGIFAGTASEGFGRKLNLVEYGWALYVYAAGAAIVTFISIMLCFASPDNPFTPVIINSVNRMLPNGRYTQMSDENVLIDESGRSAHVNTYPHVSTYPQVSYPQVQSY